MIPPTATWPGKLAQFVFCALLAGLVVVFGAGVMSGFDFTDEGSYYLNFVHPENVSDNHTSYFIFGGGLFALLGHNIVALRVATLFATFGGTLIFLHGLRSFMSDFAPEVGADREHRQLLLMAALVASFLGFAISPPALSYNFQNAFCLLAATGFLFHACAQPASPGFISGRALTALSAFGGLVGLEFFIKFSSSVPLALGGLTFFLLASRQTLTQKIVFFGGLLACVAVPAVIYFAFFQSFERWRAVTLGAILDNAYVGKEIQRYANEIAALVQPLLHNFAPVWIVAIPAVILVPALRRWPRFQAAAAALAGLWTLGHLLWLMDKLEYWRDRQLEFFAGSLILLALLLAGSGLAKRGPGLHRYWRLLAAGGLLLLLPYVGAFGTSNSINTNCLYQFAPWFALAGLMLAGIDRVWGSAWPSRIGLLLLAVVAGIQFYEGYWLQPYRVAGARSEQTVPTSIGVPATTLHLNQETHDFIVGSRRILQEHGFKAGDDLLVFFDLPGFVFAMGGTSPGHPWYFAGDKNSFALDLMRLGFIEPLRRKRAFIVRNSLDRDWNEFLPGLHTVGLNFPEDYQLITPPMISPFSKTPFEIWQPRQSAAAK